MNEKIQDRSDHEISEGHDDSGSPSSQGTYAPPSSSIADNVKRFLEDKIGNAQEGEIDSILREQQLTVFGDLAVFLASDINEGSVILPTGSGKTVIMAELANAMYYGSDDERKPKTLVLVPNIKLISQTVGEHDEEGQAVGGFARFAPDLSVTPYGGGSKDTSGDVVVMTYQSLLNAADSEGLPEFDVVLLDEAHRSLGEKTDEAVSKVSKGKKTIAFTATPDFSEVKSVREKRGEVIHEMSLREAIDLGMLAPVQVWHYKTDIKLNVPMRTGDFSERELQSLIENEARNRAAVDLATNYVSQGLQGIVACVPGNKTRHATEMAEQLSKAEITDKDGVTRKVIARSVSGNTPTEELDAIYAGYRNGSIDVLTYVDLLTEGWDAPSAKFLINLRPTKSPVNAVQRLGRVLRLYEPESVAQIVEFVDDIKGADSYNALHALGEVDAPLNSGEVYGGRSNVVTKEGVEDETELFIPDLERVRALIETCELELLSDLYLSPLEKKHRQDIEQGDLLTMQDALERIERMGGQVSATAFRNALEEVVYIGDKPYVSTEELDRVKGRYIPNEGDMRSGDINKEIGDRLEQKGLRDVSIHRAPVQTLFEYFDRTAREFKAPGAKHVGTVWDREEVEEVLSRVMEDFEEGEYETIFDYFHDDNGTRVRYDKVRFTRIEQMARGAVERRLDMMSYEQRLEALRLVVKPLYGEPNLNLAFRKDILATLSGSKNVYLRK